MQLYRLAWYEPHCGRTLEWFGAKRELCPRQRVIGGRVMQLPDVMHLLFERGGFCGAFKDRGAAERTQAARERGGHGPHEIAEYRRAPRVVTEKDNAAILQVTETTR